MGGHEGELRISAVAQSAPAVLEALGRLAAFGVHTLSLRHLGYIPSGGLYASALADFWASAINPYAGLASVSPGAAGLEAEVVRWLAEVVGLPLGASGVLTSRRSMATLTAVIAAREAAGILPSRAGEVAVYVGEHRQVCVDRALRFAGMAEAQLRVVPSDARHRLDAVALEHLLTADAAAGVRPWLVVAAAGTMSMGSADPVGRIARLGHMHGTWVHVDAAHGGLFVLCPQARALLSGLGEADSVVVDPHKTLFQPSLDACRRRLLPRPTTSRSRTTPDRMPS